MTLHALLEPDLSAVAAATSATPTIAFRVGDRVRTYRLVDGQGIAVDETASADDAGLIVAMSGAAWRDLEGQMRTFISLFLSEELTFERGTFDDLADWDPVLTLLHGGVPMYDPARADLSGIDLAQEFTLDDSDEDMRAQLTATGLILVRGVFSAEEMAEANAEIDRLAEEARRDDDKSWWVTDEDGNEVLCRLIYTSQRSKVIAQYEDDPRVARLGTLLRADLRPAPDRMEGVAVLLKVPGKTSGLSNIPWHQDCGMGGHAIYCPSVGVGIQLTGSNAETGNLTFVPGSHGQTLHYAWERRLANVPVVAIDTEPGDVTVHVKDVMHASPRPTGEGGRRTMYISHYPPTLWDHIGEGQAFNDLIRARTTEAAALATRRR